MHNIEKAKVEEIRNNSEALYSLLDEADDWITRNLKFEEAELTAAGIKNSRRIVRKIRKSLDSKPVFALFGASQVGKSYLVKNLLSVDGKPLQIRLGDDSYDFLKEINPPGVGAESTGVVTRFSIEPTALNTRYPVRIKLLDVKDIIIILCDGFFSDLKKITHYPSVEDFQQLADELEKRYSAGREGQTILVEDDLLDISEYFRTHFYKNQQALDIIDSSRYWQRLCRLISFMPPDSWPEAFSILWAKQPSLTELFKQMLAELGKMKFSDTVFTVKESVLRGHGELLDVQRLKEMRKSTDRIATSLPDGTELDIHLCTLSAVSSELSLGISPEVSNTKAFLKNTDLLDFPGARSRLELDFDTMTDESVPDMYLRGKVAYLFNKYSGDYEINNLLFCQNDKQLDVNEIPSLLHDWISNNIGKTAAERDKSISRLPISPLFVVFTFFNNQLKYDTTNDYKDDFDYKWETRFQRFFEQEVVTSSYNWHADWTAKEPLFSNFYLLRDFKYSEDTFSGFVENEVETGIRSDRAAYLGKLKDSFLGYPFVTKHFKDPLMSWESAAVPNADGSSHIIKNLEPAANNYVKMHNYSSQLLHHRNSALSRLRKYHHSDNLEEKRIAALKRANELQIELNKVFGKSPMLFSMFIHRLILSESDVYNYFHENLSQSRSAETFDEYTLFRSQYPMLKPEYPREKNLSLLKAQLFYDTDQEVERFLEETGIDLDKLFGAQVNTSGSSLVNGLFEKWISDIQYEQFTELVKAGLNRNTFIHLMEALQTTIDRLNLKEFLIGHVEKKTQRLQMGRDSEEYLASICTNYINDFIVNFGFNYMSADRLSELNQLAITYKINTEPLEANQALPTKNELREFFNADKPSELSAASDFAYMIRSYNQFLVKLRLAVLSNCGFVNYDVQANSQLSKLLDRTSALSFQIE